MNKHNLSSPSRSIRSDTQSESSANVEKLPVLAEIATTMATPFNDSNTFSEQRNNAARDSEMEGYPPRTSSGWENSSNPPLMHDGAGPSRSLGDHQIPSASSKPSGSSEARRKTQPYGRRRSSLLDEQRPQRAPQACERCRRMKLRCVGGLPCLRCKRANHTCDFGARTQEEEESSASLDPSARLAQLEKAVSNLVNNLSSMVPNPSAIVSALTGLSQRSSATTYSGSQGSFPAVTTSAGTVSNTQAQTLSFQSTPRGGAGLGLTHTSHFDQTLPPQGFIQTQSPFNSSSGQTIPSASPGTTIVNNWAVSVDPSPVDNGLSQIGKTGHSKPRTTPEARLAVAQEGSFRIPPFQPLLLRPAVWENREQSRRGSPQPGEASRDESWSTFEARAGPTSDPITDGIVKLDVAEALFDLFFQKCHSFLPIIHFDQRHLSPHVELRQRSAFLYSTVLAIASRLYHRHRERFSSAILPPLDVNAPEDIRKLAFSHLAATMMRKEHTLSDVQATMVLAVWGLLPNGKGPDPWLLTGHCQRMAQRLGIHKAATHPTILRASTWDRGQGLVIEDPEALDKALTQWKTSLYCYHFDGFLSLGFGRPLSLQPEPMNEHLYLQTLQVRMNHSEMAGDVYIACLVQLTKIGRDLISWAQMVADWHAGGYRTPLVQDGRDVSICAMMRELNKRLDDWANVWTWNGSLYAIQLGSCARFAKLQADHVRLCLNSIALKTDPQDSATGEEALLIQDCIRRAAEAAINMIQTHQDAARSDHAFSYSFEYIFNALAQAAVFLLRLYLARHPIPVERPVIVHFVRTAIEVIEETDFSVTRHSTAVARICRDLCKVAGIVIPPHPGEFEESQDNVDLNLDMTDFDFESMLQLEGAELDLGYMLGLPTEALGPIPTSSGYSGEN